MLTVRKGGHRDFERYFPLMEIDFDSEELISKLNIHRAMTNGSAELLIVTDEDSGMDAAYALVLTKGVYGYKVLKYMAVMPWLRGKGIGIQTMRLINKRYADTQGIIAELSEFDDPDPDRLKKLRRFFSRFGYQEIPSDYTISGVKVNLLVKPIKGTAELSPVIHRVITDVYSNVMGAFSLSNYMDIRRV